MMHIIENLRTYHSLKKVEKLSPGWIGGNHLLDNAAVWVKWIFFLLFNTDHGDFKQLLLGPL